MNAAAIVVTYNSEGQISRCLEPLLDAGLEVWVVDNASSDGGSRLVAERFPQVQLVVNSRNCGFARAVNQALARSDADVFLLVNPDCVVPPATARVLLDQLEAEPDVGIAAPRLRREDGAVATSAHPFESAASVLASRFGGSLLPLSLRRRVARGRRRASYELCRTGTEPMEVDWVSGACLAARGSLLRRLGGLDVGYFMYYEDEELCLQAWQIGARVVYLPGVEARHVGGASSSDPAHVWPHLYRSLLRFQALHRPRTYPLVRSAILVRALIGVTLGAGRALLGRAKADRRVLAWARVAHIAAVGSGAIVRRAT